MIAVDTNLLVYAHRARAPLHRPAQRAIERACNDPRGWGVALPCVPEFWSVVTHPSASGRPSTAAEALAFVESLVSEAGAALWTPLPGFGERLARMAAHLKITGVRIFDVAIALIAFEHNAQELWTHDQDFATVPGLRVIDPLA